MKHYFIPMMLMAAAALASCEKQNSFVEQKAQEESYVYTISAVAPDMVDDSVPAQAPGTRTNYTDAGVFSWSAGDAISVLFHKDDVNKFFTLTTTGSGTTASFSGEIEAGYTIGASDGTSSDKKIWALFPASTSHTYTEGERPTFYIPSSMDFTETHFSANLPMYDLLTDEGTLSFKHLCCAYKFIVSGLDNSVTKIQFTVTNQLSYALSGKISMSSGPYLSFGSLSNASQTITFISAVSDHSAVFYVPCRHYSTAFKPTITITDYNTGNTLKSLTATNATSLSNKGEIKPITISAPGTGTPWSFESKFGITWKDITPSVVGETSDDNYKGISLLKATSDASYIYYYFEVERSRLLLDDSYEYANPVNVYFGNSESASISWPWTGYSSINGVLLSWTTSYGQPVINSWEGIYGGSGKSGGAAVRRGDYYCNEIRVNRSYDALLQNTGTVYTGIVLYYQKYHGGSIGSNYMVAPAKWADMYTIDLPTYVAP